MKRFKFRLQCVLEQRERLEKQAIQSYAQARQAHADAESTLMDMKTLKEDLIDGLMRLRVQGSIDPHEQVIYQDYIRQVRNDIKRQEATAADLCVLAETFRQALVDASADKKAVDKLRERTLHAHVTESHRVEQSESDEMATQRHQFRRRDAA